jgi:hypothetical protein
MKVRKLYLKAFNNPKGLRFEEALRLARAFGFKLDRIEGSHHILIHPQLPKRLSFQPDNGKAKPYQVRDLLKAVRDNDLTLEDS